MVCTGPKGSSRYQASTPYCKTKGTLLNDSGKGQDVDLHELKFELTLYVETCPIVRDTALSTDHILPYDFELLKYQIYAVLIMVTRIHSDMKFFVILSLGIT